jgi:hypothetical protein
MIGPRGIAPLALRQLAAWEELAATWPLVSVQRDGRQVMICPECGIGIWLATDPRGGTYRYTDEEKQAHIVLHLRTRHPDMEPPGVLQAMIRVRPQDTRPFRGPHAYPGCLFTRR